jgi:hypothetical protein
VKKFNKSHSFEWFHDDFIRFQKDRGHGALHIGVTADQQGKQLGWECRMALITVKPSPGFGICKSVMSASKGSVVINFRASATLGTAITPNPLRARVAVAHVANGFIVIHQQDLV